MQKPEIMGKNKSYEENKLMRHRKESNIINYRDEEK